MVSFHFIYKTAITVVHIVPFLLLATSCTQGRNDLQTLEPMTYALEPGMPVVIRVNSGQVFLSNGMNGQVILSGEASASESDDVLVSQQPDGLFIASETPGHIVNLNLQVPPGTPVEIHTYGADVQVLDFAGGLDVTSTAGDIRVKNMQGLAVLRANRGDVTVESSSGEFHLPGNYGLLTLTDVSGVVEASTIMGTIRYQGRLAASDSVRLETDHGPVEARLDPHSEVTVVVKTTTGVTYCVIPGLNPEGAGCRGQLGSGKGLLQVRTVSGEVNLLTTP
jgi:hypothetical protein